MLLMNNPEIPKPLPITAKEIDTQTSLLPLSQDLGSIAEAGIELRPSQLQFRSAERVPSHLVVRLQRERFEAALGCTIQDLRDNY